jgi:uncharacterized protein
MPDILHSIKYPFAIDRGLGELAEQRDYNLHVEEMIKQVLFTAPGERINRPDFGCGLRKLVFAPNSELGASMLNVTIVQSLQRWLGTVITVADVQVNPVEEILEIRISYIVNARQERRFLNLEVTL